jgi:hypothetical protein
MSGHADQVDAFRAEATVAFGFLVAEAGFIGPEDFASALVTSGLRLHRSGLHVEVVFFDGHEPEVATVIVWVAPDGARIRASLECLYVAAGCGPVQDVPGSAPTRRAMLKRVQQHAVALRRLLPLLASPEIGQMMSRCRGRSLPVRERDTVRS